MGPFLVLVLLFGVVCWLFGLFALFDGSWPIILIELSNNDYFSTAS